MNRAAQIALALDVDTFPKAKYFVNKLYPKVKIFKVGSRVFTGCGPKLIEFINKKGAAVFLDLKFFDIPNTVANAVRQAVRHKVKMLTLHILGGDQMLSAAVKAAKEESRKLKIKRPLLIGVTVLTSEKTDVSEVLRLARAGIDCGLDGVVCSAKEAGLLRKKINKRFVIVTPGIRPKNYKADDQSRVATAQEAIKAGADFIIVGRPILEAKDPILAAKKIMGEIYGRRD